MLVPLDVATNRVDGLPSGSTGRSHRQGGWIGIGIGIEVIGSDSADHEGYGWGCGER